MTWICVKMGKFYITKTGKSVNVRVSVYVCVRACMCACAHVVCVGLCACVCVCVCARAHVSVFVCAHGRMCICMGGEYVFCQLSLKHMKIFMKMKSAWKLSRTWYYINWSLNFISVFNSNCITVPPDLFILFLFRSTLLSSTWDERHPTLPGWASYSLVARCCAFRNGRGRKNRFPCGRMGTLRQFNAMDQRWR